MKKYCEKHPEQELNSSIKEYCPICEGFFSGHGFPDMKRCPFRWKMQKEDRRNPGRAFPLVKGKTSHYFAEVFNRSLNKIPKNKFEPLLFEIFNSYQNFREYNVILLDENIIKSTERELYSFYLFKKELFESFYEADKLTNMIPLVVEEWLYIPFDKKQYNIALKEGVKRWTKIGLHNVLDEVFLDIDDQAICIDYKSYPRKKSREIGPIRSTEKKYQLITAMLTFEYNYRMDVKFVANVELGSSDFPNVQFYKPTTRGLLYYKKALLEAYKNLMTENFYPKYEKRSCIAWCPYKDICPHPEIKKYREFKVINLM